jgi:ribosomal protein S18 acetylase RimI-like enzyme
MPDIIYTLDLTQVNWDEMKAAVQADDFDNGRTPGQLKASFCNSFAACLAYTGGRLIGTARVLSDGVCNAYIVDVWTQTAYRRQGIARRMLELLLERLPGQHVYLFTDDMPDFYRRIGFTERGTGFEKVVGDWLVNHF